MMFPFEVDPESNVPLWAQLRQRLIHLISTGYFKPGEQLPTVRGLASEISINYNTVNKAYLSLVSDGYLESTHGRGVFVRDLDAEMADEHLQEIDTVLSDAVSACRDLGMQLEDIVPRMSVLIRKIKRDEAQDDVLTESYDKGRIVKIDIEPSQRNVKGA